jgi:hypothetical protein
MGGADGTYTSTHSLSKGGSSSVITAGESSTVNSMVEPNSFTFFVSMEQDRASKNGGS